MYKFAHLADCHLGAQKTSELKKLEIEAFRKSLDICIKRDVDFIIIAGDLFHSNLPDMNVVKEAVSLLKNVADHDIPVYVDYGSHDFSPNLTSIIDIITATGLLKKVFIPKPIKLDDGSTKLKLNYLIDKKTNAKIMGIPGRKIGIEDEYFDDLDETNLDEIDGFRIFVFHTSIKELIPDFLSEMEGISINKFPKNFDYYAGGHIHKKIGPQKFEDYGIFTYPGPIFGGYPRDFEFSAKGEKRGFFIVEFDKTIKNCEFIELPLVKYEFIQLTVKNENSYQFNDRVLNKIQNIDVENKIVILKLKGELSGGKSSDINFQELRKILKNNGAINVNLNHHGLVSKEFSNIMRYEGESKEEIEENILKENISSIKIDIDTLKGSDGAKKAMDLVGILKQNSKPNEKKQDYQNRILKDSLKILDIVELLDDI